MIFNVDLKTMPSIFLIEYFRKTSENIRVQKKPITIFTTSPTELLNSKKLVIHTENLTDRRPQQLIIKP